MLDVYDWLYAVLMSDSTMNESIHRSLILSLPGGSAAPGSLTTSMMYDDHAKLLVVTTQEAITIMHQHVSWLGGWCCSALCCCIMDRYLLRSFVSMSAATFPPALLTDKKIATYPHSRVV